MLTLTSTAGLRSAHMHASRVGKGDAAKREAVRMKC